MTQTRSSPEAIRLETDQPDLLLLQMLTPKDDKAYFELQNANRDYWEEFGNNVDDSIAEVTERRRGHGDGRYGIWFEGKLIGIVGYSTKGHESEAEIGILLDKNAVGHGYASAAIKALTEFAKPRFDRVFAEVAPDNNKSTALLNRSGYQTDGKVVEREWGKALVFEAPK